MRPTFTSIIKFLLLAGIGVWWFDQGWDIRSPLLVNIERLTLLGFAITIVIFIPLSLWILASEWKVKKAIEKAHELDYDGVQHWLNLNFTPLYPSPRYDDIIQLLRQLYKCPQVKPDVNLSEFSQYFISRGQGYFLTLEGRSKMFNRINSSFLSGRILDDLQQKDIYRIVGTVIKIGVTLQIGAIIIGAIGSAIYRLINQH